MVSAHRDAVSTGPGRKRFLLGLALTIIVIVVLVVAALALSSVSLASDSTALALVTGPLGGTIEHVHAYGQNGQPVPLSVEHGRLTPQSS